MITFMNTVSEWLSSNYKWLFSGVGVSIIAGLIVIIGNKIRKDNTMHQRGITGDEHEGQNSVETTHKSNAKILFIDDDRSFKIVNMLKKSGWINVDLITDINRLDDPKLQQATILFIDIQGVGKKMGFKEEGLGLAKAIRERYPAKKLVIYSAISTHDPFAEGFSAVDARLRKNAEYYEFENTIIELLSS